MGFFKREVYLEPGTPTPHPVLRDPECLGLVFPSAQVSTARPRFQVRPPKRVILCWRSPGSMDKVGEQIAKSEAPPTLPPHPASP